ncbi:hypothetical protein DFP72DRAFT_1075345 [Ephemerocybe angulata]|uniref:Uncharacterized protein n=1 Tax=Ephemerocybe angulata TaxID=980116 RepID=A0A8H6M0Q0_9AGAR|nr:hypothetical protein DFP72DRAFT_1075345 [Tulosesus angulatus]
MSVPTRHEASGQLEDELHRLQLEAQDHQHTLDRIAAQRAKLMEMKRKEEEDVKNANSAMRAQKELERKAGGQEELQEQKRRPTSKEGDLDVMGEEGKCERCRGRAIDCLRMDTAKYVKARNFQRVWIGNTAYSRCQECKNHGAKCEIVERDTNDASDNSFARDLVRVGEKRKVMGRYDDKERPVKRKLVNAPAASRRTFVQGSSSGIRAKQGGQTYRNEEVEELATRLEQEQTKVRDDLASLRMEQVGFRAALAQLEQRMQDLEES